MMYIHFTDIDSLPLVLDVKTVSEILGISKNSCYKLFTRSDFPTICIGKRRIVSRDKFFE